MSSATTACRGGRRAPRPPPFLGRRRPGPPPTVSLPGGVRLLRLARSPGAAAGSSTRRPLGGGGGGSSPCPSGAPLPSAARLSPSGAGRSPVAASPRTGVPSARLGTRATRRRCPPRCRRRPPPPAGGGERRLARGRPPPGARLPPPALDGPPVRRASAPSPPSRSSPLPLPPRPTPRLWGLGARVRLSPSPSPPPPPPSPGPARSRPASRCGPPPRPPWRGGARVAVVGRAGGRPAGCFLLRRGEVVAPGGVPRKRGDPAGPAPGGFWGRGRDRGERGRLAVGRWRGPRRGARRALVRHGPAASGGSRPSLGGVGRGRPGGGSASGRRRRRPLASLPRAPPRPSPPTLCPGT